MRTWLLWLALTSSVWAAELNQASGTLQNCAGSCLIGCSRDGLTTGVGTPTNTGSCALGDTAKAGGSNTADFVNADGASSITFLFVLGTNTTVEIENSIDLGQTWSIVPFQVGVNTTSTTGEWAVGTPTGRYRIAVTTCGAGCTYRNAYHFVNQR